MNKTENALTVFTNPEFGSVRTVELDGEPWLVGKDVAAALGYKDTINALKAHVDPEDKKGGWRIGAVDKRASKDHRLFRVSFLRKRKRPYCGLYQSY